MIQKDKTHFYQTLKGIRLFEEDINEIISRLKKYSLIIEIQDKNNLYDNIEEVKQNKGVHPKILNIDAKSKIDLGKRETYYESASLDFDRKKVRISFGGSERLYSLGFEIKDYLKARRPLYIRIFNYENWLFFASFFVGMILFTLKEKDSFYRFLILYISVPFFVVFVISVFVGVTTHGLNLTRRHEYGFWKRNKDRILVAIIAAALGVFSTLFVQWISKK